MKKTATPTTKVCARDFRIYTGTACPNCGGSTTLAPVDARDGATCPNCGCPDFHPTWCIPAVAAR
jgi:RNA polymerase subunit RPABC4/transcription elongation factor Spt4